MPAEGTWFGAAIGTVITPLKDIFFKHAMYCFNPGKYVEDYRRDTMTLIGRQTGIQGEINTGEPNGLIATPDADYWVKRANQAISEEATNREQYEKRGRFFCCGSLNCCANYKIAKRAVEASREVSSCLDSIPSNATARKPPPPVQYKSIVESPELPGHETILKTACESINNQVRIIGIWGPDGVGNTHLLKKINNSFVGSDPSHFVIFVTASSEFSVQNMQNQIIQRLELRKDDVAANPATNILELLRARDFLLLVDGLYEKLDLQAVGIPHPLGIFKGFKRKVVITSQSKKLCDRMGVDEYIEVPCFEESKALELFKHKIGRKDIYSDRHIGALAHCLVNELKGVPSELIHFGEQMVGKNDPLVWEDVIRTVRKSNLQNKDPTLAARTLRNLEDATSNLVAKINDIRNKIKVAEGNGMVSTNEVDKWLEKADTINADVQIIFAGNKKLKKDVTREAIEKLSEVQECLRSCPNNGNIAFKSVPPPAQEKPGPSMSAPNDNLKKALQLITDDPVGMIGIAGSGGIGKTYLLNSINNSIANAGGMSFQVIFVTASKGCSVKKIQESILVNIGLEKGGNVESRSKMIFNFLKKGSFLLLLDDVWEKIDLHAVGVPYPLGIVNQLKRKVVLTTRLQNVIREMKVGEKLNVVCLQEDEAWQLFQENVSEITLSSDPRIKGFARVLMKELKGLPLALEVIGSAMRGKNDPLEWEYAIQHMQLSRCEEGEGGMKTVFKQLKFSYDRLLNDTLRDCFVTWALWPEDCKIPKLDLAQCWMGLGLVDEGDIESSYRKAYSLIGQLRDASLIESCGSWYGYVKMHDVMRDMALWISCGCGEDNDKWFVHAGVDEHKLLSIPWSKVEYISLMKIQMNEFPPSCFNSCTIELKMLCLRSCRLDRGIAQTIKNFTSLTYLDLSMMRLQNIPNELCSLVDLEHLDLSHNDLIAQVPHCFGNLVKLKFLYLQSSGIGRIPKGVISNFQALQVIDLRTSRHGVGNCNHAVFRELGDLRLQAASIEACGFNRYESLAGAAKLPIRSLTLNGLNGRPEFCLSDLSSLGFVQRSLYELEIKGSRMKIIIVGHELAQPDYHFPTLNKINLFMLGELKEIRWAGRSPESVFPRLTYLVVAVCPSLEHLSWVIYLPYLEQLEIRCCATMKQAFLEPIQHGTFPCLKHLRLRANLNLVTIGDAGVRFPSLELLEVSRCPELKMLPFQMDSLPLKLQELRFDNSGCWEKLELEDGVKSFLQPTLKFGSEWC